MKLIYRVHKDPVKGWCAQLSTDNAKTWKQVSFWYTTLKRLCYYFASKNGLVLDPTTNFLRWCKNDNIKTNALFIRTNGHT